MSDKKLVKLSIDNEFRDLVRPLTPSEYKQLTDNLRRNGCQDPIVVWNGVIIDGHNRYAICMHLKIPFAITELQFENRAEVISWICANQLGRRNLSEESRKYLIGKRYEAEKFIAMNRNPSGRNQYMLKEEVEPIDESIDPDDEVYDDSSITTNEAAKGSRHATAERIGAEYHISHGTVEKYGYYSRALDAIAAKEPSLFPRILSGRYKISHRNVMELAQKDKDELKWLNRQMNRERKQKPFVPYAVSRQQISETEKPEIQLQTGIKNMPEFDPDAEIAGLTLTIPAWLNSIERTMTRADLSIVTPQARRNLEEALSGLQNAIFEILKAIKE